MSFAQANPLGHIPSFLHILKFLMTPFFDNPSIRLDHIIYARPRAFNAQARAPNAFQHLNPPLKVRATITTITIRTRTIVIKVIGTPRPLKDSISNRSVIIESHAYYQIRACVCYEKRKEDSSPFDIKLPSCHCVGKEKVPGIMRFPG